MIVSWDWLQEYVTLDMPLETLTDRLTMSGLNLEGVESIDGDTAIDLEVTSNRPDCLGHLGVAREIAVLFDRELTTPPAEVAAVAEKTADATSVGIECDDLCSRYVARVIRGVQVGPSPDWLRRRLATLGVASINNVVDITNYVLMECGQPLHAFDFDKLQGQQIVVRRAVRGEKITAIDQREYELDDSMCVIADAERPVAIGGVMGGLDTEIGDGTTDVLVEVADFTPLSIRNTARKLNLHSPSSFRFERGVDAARLDWASRRCCDLILELAGGELLDDAVFAGLPPDDRPEPVSLRFAQVPRVLGIDVPAEECVSILERLGLETHGEVGATSGSFVPPSWRRDLTREIDLVEEVARIHGYDEIPQDVVVPMSFSAKTRRDSVLDEIRGRLTAAGMFEAITLSFVSEDLRSLFTPRGDLAPLKVEHSSRRHENILRPSLIPSLLQSRRENERHGVANAELFEVAKVYLKAAPGEDENAVEPTMVGLVGGRSFAEMKGVVEALVHRLNRTSRLGVLPSGVPQFAPGRGADLLLNDQPWGWLGEIDRSVSDRLDLRDAVTVAEFDLALLEATADLHPQYEALPQYPAIHRDLNFVLDEAVTWARLASTVRDAAGELLESVGFGGQYRGKQIEAGKKSYVLTLSFRSPDRTLTSDEVDAAQQAVVLACEERLAAALR